MRRAFYLAAMLATVSCAPADSWPQWRGPAGLGVVVAADLPLTWSDSDNVLWRTRLEGRGHSSPVVWGNRVFVTAAVEGDEIPGAAAPVHMRDGFFDENPDNRTRYVHPDSVGAGRRHTFVVVALDADGGELLWRQVAYEGAVFDDRHRQGSYASATPATDGERLFVWFGSQGLYVYDLDGELLWEYDPGDLPNWGLGHGNSPVLYDNLVILLCDRDNGDESFLLALDAATGEEVWRAARTVRTSWSTPLLVESAGRFQLVTSGHQWIISYDPGTGEELWRTRGLYDNVIATPVANDRMVFLSAGYPQKVTKAVNLDAVGEIGDADLAWQYGKGTAYVPSNLLLGEYLYLISDNGTLTCLDADTGEVVYEGGRVPVPTRFTASPVAFGDKILLSGQDGDMFVIQAGPEHGILASNSISEPLWASPAIAGDRLYVRGGEHLYAIGRE